MTRDVADMLRSEGKWSEAKERLRRVSAGRSLQQSHEGQGGSRRNVLFRVLKTAFLPRPKPNGSGAKTHRNEDSISAISRNQTKPKQTVTYCNCFVGSCSESGAFGTLFLHPALLLFYLPAKTVTKAERERREASKQAERPLK